MSTGFPESPHLAPCINVSRRARESPDQENRSLPTPRWGSASTPEKETTMSRWKTIVVGVDGSAGSRKALTWAAAEAADHGAELVVVNVWEHTLLPPAGSVTVSEHYVPDPSQRTADDLVQVIKEELGEQPPVLVQPRVKQGRPAKVLIDESATADLLVVGVRGHGGFAGLILGSVSQHVAAYAQCPVTVAR
jgi:nucleotide-binding universal stress UspA family protein